jgi:hypothetical protein
MAAIDEQNAKKAESIIRQIALNEAIASGNVQEQKRIEALIESDKRTADIEKKTAELVKALGLAEGKARALATRFVDAQIAAINASKAIASVRDAIEATNKEKMDNPPKTLKERTQDAREALSDMKDFIGQDMNRMSLASIIDKLGLDVPGLTNTQEQLDHIEKAIKTLEDADPADLTPDVDAFGFNKKLDKVKEYLRQAEQDKADMTPEIDQSKIEKAAGEAKDRIEAERPEIVAEVDQAALNDAVSQLQAEINNEFTGGEGGDGGEGGSGGEGGAGGDASATMGPLERIAEEIHGLVRKIEEKLPMQALA